MTIRLIAAAAISLLALSAPRADEWNFQFVGFPLGDRDVMTIEVDPDSANIWYVTSEANGVYITRDFGLSWENHLSGFAGASCTVDPTNANSVFASSDDNLYRSDDKGHSWKLAETFPGYLAAIHVSPTDSAVYVGIKWFGAAPGFNGIFKSTDHGVSFANQAFATPDSFLIIWDIEEDTANNKLYAATEIATHPTPYNPPIFRSSNGGATWDEISGVITWHCLKVQVHPVTHEVYALTEGLGLYKSRDYGDNWEFMNNFFMADLVIDPNDPDRFFGAQFVYGTRNAGVYFSNNKGVCFDLVSLTGRSVGDIALDAASTAVYCTVYGTGIYAGASAGPRTWYVKPDGTGDVPTIQDALSAASAGDTVMLANGTFTGAGNRDLDLGCKSIALVSQSRIPDSCIVDCEGVVRGLQCQDATDKMVMSGFTVTNGYAALGGFQTQFGGAILAADCQNGPSVSNCVFRSNHAEGHGGAVFAGATGTPVFNNCRFIENTADLSGGAFLSGYGAAGVCSPTFNDCVFFDNKATGAGGAVTAGWSTSGLGTFSGCVFAGNRAELGGAIYASFYQCNVTQCTFAADSAGLGSAVYSNFSPVNFENTIFAFGTGGGAIACNSASPTLTNCDVYGNAGGDWTGCIAGQAGNTGNFSTNPLFCDAAAGDFTLASISDCLPANNTWGERVGALGLGCSAPTGIEETSAPLLRLALDPNYPNPFNPVTTIAYTLPEAGFTRVVIYDVSGRLVTTLVNGANRAGRHRFKWDGRNSAGAGVSSGVYFVRLEFGGEVHRQKLILIK